MAIAVGSSAYQTVVVTHKDNHSETTVKQFSVDPSTDAADLATFLTAYQGLTNAAFIKPKVTTTAKITGATAAPIDAQYDVISMAVALTFSQTSPDNPDLTLYHEFVIPCVNIGMIDTDGISIVAPVASGGTTVQIELFNLLAYLTDHLVVVLRATGTVVVGGWTYLPSKSGLISTGRKFDGQPG